MRMRRYLKPRYISLSSDEVIIEDDKPRYECRRGGREQHVSQKSRYCVKREDLAYQEDRTSSVRTIFTSAFCDTDHPSGSALCACSAAALAQFLIGPISGTLNMPCFSGLQIISLALQACGWSEHVTLGVTLRGCVVGERLIQLVGQEILDSYDSWLCSSVERHQEYLRF